MSAVLTPTRLPICIKIAAGLRWLGAKCVAMVKAAYVRRLIASAEFDIAGYTRELTNLPERIRHHEERAAQLRVDLALLEKI